MKERVKGEYFARLEKTIDRLRQVVIDEGRIGPLNDLSHYVRRQLRAGTVPSLNFICTHNSRRSQFAQVWAQTACAYFGISALCQSAGVEVTSFNTRAVDALERCGFVISSEGDPDNPRYYLRYSNEAPPIVAWSKLIDSISSDDRSFAAVMTCSDVDERCPFVPGAEMRIPLYYNDPKEADDTAVETEVYDRRCEQIGAEMFYVFEKISQDQ